MFRIFSGYRRYIKTVGDCLRLLFVDFPPGTLAKLEGAIAIDAITAAMFKGKSMDAVRSHDCAHPCRHILQPAAG